MPAAKKNLVASQPQPKTVVTLERNDCRWPFGDPRHADFHFCGQPRKNGSAYCEAHAARSFQPSQPRRAYQQGAAERPGQLLLRQAEPQRAAARPQLQAARTAR